MALSSTFQQQLSRCEVPFSPDVVIRLFEHQPGFVRRDLLRLCEQRIAFLFLAVGREVLGEVDNPTYLSRSEFKARRKCDSALP